MSDSSPEIVSVVIENGTATTRAGFSNEELPSLSFPTSYSKNSSEEVIIGDDISKYPENSIFTIVNDGVVYNWKALEANWRFVYDKLKVSPEDYPLVITEELWNNKKNRSKLAELAFVTFKVPVLTILKAPIAVTYGLGRSTSLVIDVGASTVSITPIVEGTILNKGALHSKFAGDFLNLHILEFLNKLKPVEGYFEGSESFKKFKVNELLTDFKSTVLEISSYPIVSSNANFHIDTKNYQLPDGTIVDIGKEQLTLAEALFHPLSYSLNGIELPQDSLGLTDLIISGLKKLEVVNDVYKSLLTNIVITGGGSLLSGFENRIIGDLSRLLPNFTIQTYTNPTLSERIDSTWIGAGIVAGMNSFNDNYLSKSDYDSHGEEAVFEKFK